ncbi:ThuA domain-containing protein [Roseiconus nitratireducens]|nr:ThuA domain-containing protein [Roseiconus nitratireducens]
MPNSARLLAPLLLSSTFLLSVAPAQEPTSWEQQKAERFQPLDDQTKERIAAAVPESPAAKPSQDRRILVFYRCEGFIHSSIPHANECVRALAEKTGAFEVDFADTYDVFSDENLAKYDAILLNNTTKMQFQDPAQQNAMMDFIAEGNGLIGIHAASDNFNRYPECLAMVGGTFAGHPWGAGGTWAFKLDDPNHVLNQAFGGKGFWHQDEIYQYAPDSYVGPEVLRVLVSLDMSQAAVSERIDDGPREVPVSWIRTAGDGRVFYTNFGHREETYQQPPIVKHLLDGIQYALGDLEADATPTAKLQPTDPAPAPQR